LAVDDIYNQHMDSAVKYYSSLFALPAYNRIVTYTTVACVAGGLSSALVFHPDFEGLILGLLFGLALTLITLLSNNLVALALRGDPIYDVRRSAGLSLFSWILWDIFTLMGGVAAALFAAEWAIKLCLLGSSVALILRFVVLYSTSSISYKRIFVASVLQPYFGIAAYTPLWLSKISIEEIIIYSAYSSAICFTSSFAFLYLINRVGKRIVNVPSLSILKAFLLNWIADLNTPFEDILEELSVERDIEVSILKFENQKSETKVVIILPSVHPGPFKNIGSSFLPSMLKKAVEQKFNCVACVPLGLLGHDLDLASQLQNQKIIDQTLKSLEDVESFEAGATPLVKVRNGFATVCCQIFGDIGLVTFSLAPKTTEDLPQELAYFVNMEARKYGINSCMVANAHNSINGFVNHKETMESLKAAASLCLRETTSTSKKPFKVGASTIMPKNFGLKDGMGPGGITSIVVEVDSQKFAYVIIDGNNLISGLREKILSSLCELGFSEGEVLTTDTHSVNALTLTPRGYNPVGEVIPHDILVNHIKEAIKEAIAKMEIVQVGYKRIVIPKVKVIGKEPLEKLCMLPDETTKLAKRIIAPIFATAIAFLMLFMLTLM